jgi:hypothetical protein
MWTKSKYNKLRRTTSALFEAFLNELELIYKTNATTNENGDRTYPRECLKLNTTPSFEIQPNNQKKI